MFVAVASFVYVTRFAWLAHVSYPLPVLYVHSFEYQVLSQSILSGPRPLDNWQIPCHILSVDSQSSPYVKPTKFKQALGKNYSRGDRLSIFKLSRENGDTIIQASEKAGISNVTGTNWEKARRAQLSESSSPTVLQKVTVSAILSRDLANPETPVQYKAAIANQLARLEGYESAQKVEISDKTPRAPLSELFDVWLKRRLEREMEIVVKEVKTDALADGEGGSPQADVDENALTISPSATEISKKV